MLLHPSNEVLRNTMHLRGVVKFFEVGCSSLQEGLGGSNGSDHLVGPLQEVLVGAMQKTNSGLRHLLHEVLQVLVGLLDEVSAELARSHNLQANRGRGGQLLAFLEEGELRADRFLLVLIVCSGRHRCIGAALSMSHLDVPGGTAVRQAHTAASKRIALGIFVCVSHVPSKLGLLLDVDGVLARDVTTRH